MTQKITPYGVIFLCFFYKKCYNIDAMNPDKFLNKIPDAKTENSPKTAEESIVNDYMKNVVVDMDEAFKIKEELVAFREEHKNKDKSKENTDEKSPFDKRNPHEVALRQKVRKIISEAVRIENAYGIKVDMPDFNETLGEEGLNELEGPIREKHTEIAERKKAA